MPIEVELPNGAVAEFPDGTSPEMIKSIVSKKFPKQQPPNLKQEDLSWEGMGLSVDKTIDGIKGLFLRDPAAKAAHEAEVAEKRRLDAPIRESDTGRAGEMWGDIAQVAVPGAKASQLAAKATTRAPSVLKVAASLGTAGATNAAYEGVQQPEPGETREENATAGGLYGVAGQATGNVLGRATRGLVRKGQSASKLPQGVQDKATLGQLADRTSLSGRFASSIEEKLTSMPFAGDIIKNARTRGMDAWRDNVMSKVTPPGKALPGGDNMREVVDQIQTDFDDAYKAALSGHQIGPSTAFEARVARITRDPKYGLTPAQQEQIRDISMSYYNETLFGRGGKIPADRAKEYERFLSAQQRTHATGQAPNSHNMGNAFGDIEKAWESGYRSQLPLATRRQMKPIDQKYAPFKTGERASTSVGNEEGAFTPSQLLLSAKSRTSKPQFAAGKGLLQEDADIGKTVFQDKIANSGTADRVMNTGMIGAAIMDPLATGSALIGGTAVATPLMVTGPGKRMMMGDTKVQMLLKKMRADRLAEAAGLPISQYTEGLLED